MMRIPMTTQSDELRHARAVLAALADNSVGLAGLPAIEALAHLDLVHPPHPPVDLRAAGLGPVTEESALAALRAAAAVAANPQEAVRIVRAAESLMTPVLE